MNIYSDTTDSKEAARLGRSDSIGMAAFSRMSRSGPRFLRDTVSNLNNVCEALRGEAQACFVAETVDVGCSDPAGPALPERIGGA